MTALKQLPKANPLIDFLFAFVLLNYLNSKVEMSAFIKNFNYYNIVNASQNYVLNQLLL